MCHARDDETRLESARSFPTAGVVLTGGLSSRMGTNKALVAVDGLPLAARVCDVLVGAGCAPVWFQGGDPDELAVLADRGEVRPDLWPREGPVGAIASALDLARSSAPSAAGVLVAACDLIDLDVDTVRAVVGAGRGGPADVNVAVAVANVESVDVESVDLVDQTDRPHQRRRHLLSWWPVGLTDTVATLFASGTTSYRGLLAELAQSPTARVAVVDVAVASAALRNANVPGDLPPTG